MRHKSSLYVGHVTHNRLHPKRHALKHRVFWLYLDLAEAAQLGQDLRLFGYNRTNIFALFDKDHGDGSGKPLLAQIHAHLRAANVDTDGVSVRLLCMPRVFGYVFNPLSVYYCFNTDQQIVAMIYEVNNTFGGRHTYVFATPCNAGRHQHSCGKDFYVSPFLDMDIEYRFSAPVPDREILLSIQGGRSDRAIINAMLKGKRRELSDWNLCRLGLSHPILTIKVIVAIHWHALRMWLSGFRVEPLQRSSKTNVSIVRTH